MQFSHTRPGLYRGKGYVQPVDCVVVAEVYEMNPESRLKRGHLDRMLKYYDVADELSKEELNGVSFFRVFKLATCRLRQKHRINLSDYEKIRMAFVLGNKFTFSRELLPTKYSEKHIQVALLVM